MCERDKHTLGDLVITTERRPDGTIVVRIDPGKERLEIHQYPRGSTIR